MSEWRSGIARGRIWSTTTTSSVTYVLHTTATRIGATQRISQSGSRGTAKVPRSPLGRELEALVGGRSWDRPGQPVLPRKRIRRRRNGSLPGARAAVPREGPRRPCHGLPRVGFPCRILRCDLRVQLPAACFVGGLPGRSQDHRATSETGGVFFLGQHGGAESDSI